VVVTVEGVIERGKDKNGRKIRGNTDFPPTLYSNFFMLRP